VPVYVAYKEILKAEQERQKLLNSIKSHPDDVPSIGVYQKILKDIEALWQKYLQSNPPRPPIP
jgi:hypothetical protein